MQNAISTIIGLLLCGLYLGSSGKGISPEDSILRVGVAGEAPFVSISPDTDPEGIAVEIWQGIADAAGWEYRYQPFPSVPDALNALDTGALDVVIGPVSITAERYNKVIFTQPFFESGLSILSRTDPPSLWQRISPFFSKAFFIAAGVLLLILGSVGTLIWLAERTPDGDQFPYDPAHGIANGIWLAVVTMTTVGYGDRAPRTFWGRLVTGIWMLICVVTATSMVASIASTLTLTGMTTTTISNAGQLKGKRVAVLKGSPAEDFIRKYTSTSLPVFSLEAGFGLLKRKKADALVYDRPQLLYYLNRHADEGVGVSKKVYLPEGYGFALRPDASFSRELNIRLLQLMESGRTERIINGWLNDPEQAH